MPDGTVYRVLDQLMMLEGERLSYRSLDVEQIGAVYEGLMGFTVEVTAGPSLAVRPDEAEGAALEFREGQRCLLTAAIG